MSQSTVSFHLKVLWKLYSFLSEASAKRAKVYRTFKEVGRKDTLRFQRMGTGKK